MENLGVAVSIIIDDTEESVDSIIMSDDGTGGGLRIPAMLISKRDGKRLIDFLSTASEDELNSIVILASFDANKPDDRVEYDIWYTSSNDRALDFIVEFSETDKEMNELVLMTPHFVFWKCSFCEETYLNNDCYGNGKYCAIEPSNEKIKGRAIIEEDLRQRCLYDEVYNKTSTRYLWWAYIKYVHINCYSVINEDCSKAAHKSLSLDFDKT